MLKKFFLLGMLTVGGAFAQEATPEIHTAVDVRPSPVMTPPPDYSKELRAAGTAGVVLLSVVIDDKGKVQTCEVIKSAARELERPSVVAVKRWKFKPAEKNGQPVWTRLQIPIQFSVDAD